MNYIKGNILDIEKGVIIHQVNCMGKIGVGLSGQIIKKYPEVENSYHMFLSTFKDPRLVLGEWNYVSIIGKNLTIVNLYSQLNYGNAYKTHKVYTDIISLVKGLRDICESYFKIYDDENSYTRIYIPYGIGCGLGGERWKRVEPLINHLPLTVVKL